EAVANAIGELAHRAPFGEVRQRLSGIGADLADVAREIRSIGESCDDDPERLEWIRRRRQFLRDLQRKYGDDLGQVLGYLDEIRRRLGELESFEERVAALETRRRAVAEMAASAATDVAASRRRAAPELARAISRHLPELALDKAVIDVDVSGEDPADEVRLLFTANPGMPLAPLSKVASGGELARTMLAIRLVLSQGPPILVFDEVDAGIGGAAANALAGSLARLGRTHQVLVVTHLAQVAAAADHQIVVEKSVLERGTNSVTTARARTVSGGERTDEIARMLSGHPDSEAARRHAAELLENRANRSG
ncbi:MAG: DNA repair protein RecN, partial [Actinomycetota bacterium]